MDYRDEMGKSNIIIYTTEDGLSKIETTFDGDTVWLSIDQMAELFQRDKSTISRHIKNIYSEEELVQEATVAYFATVQKLCATERLECAVIVRHGNPSCGKPAPESPVRRSPHLLPPGSTLRIPCDLQGLKHVPK